MAVQCGKRKRKNCRTAGLGPGKKKDRKKKNRLTNPGPKKVPQMGGGNQEISKDADWARLLGKKNKPHSLPQAGRGKPSRIRLNKQDRGWEKDKGSDGGEKRTEEQPPSNGDWRNSVEETIQGKTTTKQQKTCKELIGKKDNEEKIKKKKQRGRASCDKTAAGKNEGNPEN